MGTPAMSLPMRIGMPGVARITERVLVAPAAITGARLVAMAAKDRDMRNGSRPSTAREWRVRP